MFCVLGITLVQEGNIEKGYFQYSIHRNDIMIMQPWLRVVVEQSNRDQKKKKQKKTDMDTINYKHCNIQMINVKKLKNQSALFACINAINLVI